MAVFYISRLRSWACLKEKDLGFFTRKNTTEVWPMNDYGVRTILHDEQWNNGQFYNGQWDNGQWTIL